MVVPDAARSSRVEWGEWAGEVVICPDGKGRQAGGMSGGTAAGGFPSMRSASARRRAPSGRRRSFAAIGMRRSGSTRIFERWSRGLRSLEIEARFPEGGVACFGESRTFISGLGRKVTSMCKGGGIFDRRHPSFPTLGVRF